MSTNLKYFQLLQQIEKNPLRSKVAAAADIVGDFKLDMERVAADRRLSPSPSAPNMPPCSQCNIAHIPLMEPHFRLAQADSPGASL